ncbi:MAG: hypothetical protein AVDCRST_MAG49-4128 [uncultured Thermomicrobiales bacterium]|uniref:Uncharacterized protein n=1 Tax=uncultured Thermomicrobiales bacterium TaxID=1645740 RepID=A0A6J4VD49_9BACT|nr:MAG: hypothetical protein AVDCRST_MAG49-4128 [uncultured Thermomicrobiales bacterium]
MGRSRAGRGLARSVRHAVTVAGDVTGGADHAVVMSGV